MFKKEKNRLKFSLEAAPAQRISSEQPKRRPKRSRGGKGCVCPAPSAPCAAGSCERGRGGTEDAARPRDLLSFQQGVQILRLYVRAFVPLRVELLL